MRLIKIYIFKFKFGNGTTKQIFNNSNRQTAKMTRQIGIFLPLQFLEAYFESDSENFVENYKYKEMCMYNKR